MAVFSKGIALAGENLKSRRSRSPVRSRSVSPGPRSRSRSRSVSPTRRSRSPSPRRAVWLKKA
ncbi:hypothetical protein MAR_023761 [Mya arenaria]|uniref:Uncharacterized protein n=1 Tax=Mya arenaria TaxID=6604 RepID=A0ABY7DTG2_MYAAR|nr:hypothetical protein MAR_023761 [Mya arenaria]